MAKSPADQVTRKIDQAAELYHRLLMVVAPAGRQGWEADLFHYADHIFNFFEFLRSFSSGKITAVRWQGLDESLRLL